MNQSLRSTFPHPNLSYGAAAIKASDYVRLGPGSRQIKADRKHFSCFQDFPWEVVVPCFRSCKVKKYVVSVHLNKL